MISGSCRSFSITSVFTTSCSATPSSREDTGVPPRASYLYSFGTYATPALSSTRVAIVVGTLSATGGLVDVLAFEDLLPEPLHRDVDHRTSQVFGRGARAHRDQQRHERPEDHV